MKTKKQVTRLNSKIRRFLRDEKKRSAPVGFVAGMTGTETLTSKSTKAVR